MAKNKDDFDNFRQYRLPVKNRLSEFQLQEMENEITEKYTSKTEIVFLGKETVKIFDSKKFFIAKGALTRDGAIIIKNLKLASYLPNGKLKENSDSEPILWEQLQEDLKQFWAWKGRKNFVEQKKIEGLESLASTLSLPENW